MFSGISNYDGMITSAYDVFSNTELITNEFADYWFKYVFSNRYYKKYKLTLITDITSNGLIANTKFVKTDNKWIKNVPTLWKTMRLKYILQLKKGYGISKEDIMFDGDSSCIRYGEIYTKFNISFDECITKTNLSKVDNPQYFSCDDILFTCTGELVEEIGKPVVCLGQEKCLAGGDIVVAKHDQDPLFMAFALNSEISQKQRSYGKAKLKVVHISADQIGNTVIALPPIEEQKEIGLYLRKKCLAIDSIIVCKEQKIEKLEQYKKSMIYEYVTGKRE